MYGNNWNNGMNGNYNNGWYNGNGYNNGGYNNGGYQQQQYQAFNADSIIMELENAITSVLNGLIRNPLHVRDVISKMIREGKIKMIGGGQNRVAVEIVPDHSKYKQICGINGPMLLMIPVKLPEGFHDNSRAAYGYQWVHSNPNVTSAQFNIVRQTYLPSVLIPNTHILAQKRIIRIEDCNGVRGMLANPTAKKQYNATTEMGSVCRDYLLENPNIRAQYEQLIRSYDAFFVMADLNAEFSPWNFGIDLENGRETLKIIDYGYMTPKIRPLICPVCGHELRYCIPGEEFVRDNKLIAVQMSTFGHYSCKNPNCKHKVNGKTSPFTKRDIDVFLDYQYGNGQQQ